MIDDEKGREPKGDQPDIIDDEDTDALIESLVEDARQADAAAKPTSAQETPKKAE